MRCLSSSRRLGEWRTSNQRVILLLTLLTFCPPGPPLREAVKINSFSGMERKCVILTFPSSLSIYLKTQKPFQKLTTPHAPMTEPRTQTGFFFEFIDKPSSSYLLMAPNIEH